MTATWALGRRDGAGEARWGPMVGLSVMLHLALLSMIAFVPESISFKRPVSGVVYEVSLVEMPAGGPGKAPTGAAKKGATKESVIHKPSKARRIAPPPAKEKPVVIAKRTAEKRTPPAEKKRESPSKLIERAISRIEKKVESEKPSHLDRALSALEDRVGEGAGAGTPGIGATAGLPMQIYQMEVESWIKSNWSYPVAVRDQEDLEAVLVLTARSDGKIMDSRFEKRSSNLMFDESVTKAVEKSDPLPPFPEGYRKSYEEFEIRFNLKDLEE
ncbi:MAG: TonB C-terminal domain-containing protein [Deltaproteobacteria bacterium]|nr:TonB C-terminal domain-containing protein [Deltaproteobacteria bacterium]